MSLKGHNVKIATTYPDLKFPKEPKRPVELKKLPPESGKDIYWEHQKELHPEFIKSTPENEKIIKDRWSRLGTHKKERYHGIAAEARKIYKQTEREYKVELSAWKKTYQKVKEEHDQKVQQRQSEALALKDKENSLFNKVVKLREDALEGKEYKYWFVLTYIPDLKWCHLAPMVQEGNFGPERKRSYGRPRYRLVNEKLGRELDISSMYCIPVKSKALKKTADADKEEWDIIDGSVTLVKEDAISTLSDSANATGSTRKKLSKQPKFRARSPIKPLNGKIVIGTTARPPHSQDPLQLTSSNLSVSGNKRRLEKISSEEVEKEVVKVNVNVNAPMRERQRRRCMRCIDNGASPSIAIECLGAKGRFGRDACEYFDANGACKKDIKQIVFNEEEKIVASNIATGNEKIEVPLTSSTRPRRRPDVSTT